MIRIVVSLLTLFATSFAYAQEIFAHNDYVKPVPFFKAFELKVTYIEADVFLEDGKLLVAHTKEEIDPSKTLETMYLKPLSDKVKDLYGLNLMIDIKTEGPPTLDALVKLLEKFPELISFDKLHFVISGNYPPPSEWKNYPLYIWFDGRPNVKYERDQSLRLRMISTSFPGVSAWNGQGDIPKGDIEKIKQIIADAYAYEVPMRFWASPDSENAWKKFIAIGVDILNTDKPAELAAFLKR